MKLKLFSSAAELKKRLLNSLDESQSINDLPELLATDGFAKIDKLPIYELKGDERMADKVQRLSLTESPDAPRRVSPGTEPPLRPETQIFYDFRRILLDLAQEYDSKNPYMIVKDKEDTSAIFIKVAYPFIHF